MLPDARRLRPLEGNLVLGAAAASDDAWSGASARCGCSCCCLLFLMLLLQLPLLLLFPMLALSFSLYPAAAEAAAAEASSPSAAAALCAASDASGESLGWVEPPPAALECGAPLLPSAASREPRRPRVVLAPRTRAPALASGEKRKVWHPGTGVSSGKRGEGGGGCYAR